MFTRNKGKNPWFSIEIKNMFDKRLELKREKNAAQMVYKLAMISSYGI
jgi:hypothetical protein